MARGRGELDGRAFTFDRGLNFRATWVQTEAKAALREHFPARNVTSSQRGSASGAIAERFSALFTQEDEGFFAGASVVFAALHRGKKHHQGGFGRALFWVVLAPKDAHRRGDGEKDAQRRAAASALTPRDRESSCKSRH